MPKQFSRSWWGQKFIEAMEEVTDSGRLSRGRSYARGGKVKSINIDMGFVSAQIQGSINPYFGVYEIPLYQTLIDFEPISKAKWTAAIAVIASKASLISRLLMNEIPDNIEDSFKLLGINLLPYSREDFHTRCSCPDWSNPCKHIAGLYYLIAAELDCDPFLLFELRGLSREDLKAELAKSPLGQALSSELSAQARPPVPVERYYTNPATTDATPTSLKDFWHGETSLPETLEAATPAIVPAILVKKQGDFPAFWHRDNSFLEAMETFYQRVRTKNKNLF